MDLIQTAAREFLISLALGVLALAGAYATYYLSRLSQKLKTQTQAIQDEGAREVLLRALEDVGTLTRTTVEALEQTTASALRELVQDNQVDREELLSVGRKAFDELKARITPQAQQVITENMGSFDAYLKDLLESEVYRLKQGTDW